MPVVASHVLKNASESVSARVDAEGEDGEKGYIGLTLSETGAASGENNSREVKIVIEDNGVGLPKEDRDRLTEPYVTTRTKGTGLGLAIVKKIMEDHTGDLLLEDRGFGGASISLVFRPGSNPQQLPAVGQENEETEMNAHGT